MIPSSRSPVVPGINPGPILDMNYAFARTATLVAAVRLHIFTLLSDRELTPAALAAIAKTEPGPTERLLNGLRNLGLVEREGDVYRLTPIANHFLVEGKPSYLGGDTLAMLDYFPFDDRSGPPFALTLDLSMLVNTSQGRIFTFQEFSMWLQDSGFQEVSRLDVAGPSPLIVAKKGEGRLWNAEW